MVQKGSRRPPGRPREYDPEVALRQATDAFWDGGYAGTSLDELSARTGMNRPSLYAAFGDKEALYLRTLDGYIAGRREFLRGIVSKRLPLAGTLREMYRMMIDRFTEGEAGERGCYLISTAVTEALGNPKVRERLTASQREIDGTFRDLIAAARERGEIAADADPAALALIASALVHSLAARARGGQPRAQLLRIADAAVRIITRRG
jgi:AcrR family transcriptional regulator